MIRAALAITTLLACARGFAQRPSNPNLLIPQSAPDLDYVAVDATLAGAPIVLPGGRASVAFDSKGHKYVLNRGPQPLIEFDANGKFLRVVGDGFSMTRAHGMRIDRDDN